MANIVLTILHLISTTVGGLFRHDSTTGAASVEFWVAAATTLLLIKFAVDSIGPASPPRSTSTLLSRSCGY
ncbi:hypothetical protein EE612_053759 [Oryza sativa]|jgi:hypothetical protein|nr:hypothetical protein EE612_053759 [Oryza sativa]